MKEKSKQIENSLEREYWSLGICLLCTFCSHTGIKLLFPVHEKNKRTVRTLSDELYHEMELPKKLNRSSAEAMSTGLLKRSKTASYKNSLSTKWYRGTKIQTATDLCQLHRELKLRPCDNKPVVKHGCKAYNIAPNSNILKEPSDWLR